MELLTPAEKNLITVNHTKLLKNLYLSEDLFALMLENKSFTESMVDDIKHAGTPRSQTAKLLQILPCRPRRALQTFIRALVFTDQEALALLLNTNLASKFIEERDRLRKGEMSSSQPTPDPKSDIASILLPTPSKPMSPVKTPNPSPSDQVVIAPPSLPSEKSPPKPRHVEQQSGGATPAAESECPMDVENNPDDDIIKSLTNFDPDTLRIDSCLNQSDIVDQLNCSVKKSFAFIINNMGKEVEEHIAITFARISVFFDNMSFRDTVLLSDVCLDKLRGEIRKNLGRISSSDAFVVYFLGRGNSLETIFMSSSQAVSIYNDFMALFSEENVPILRGKPKLFVFHIAQLDSSCDESVDVDLVDADDANLNDSWNDTIIFRTLSAGSFLSDEESKKSICKFVLPFYGFVMVAKKYMGTLSTYDVLLKVRQILTLLRCDPSYGIVHFALRQTPRTDGVPPLSFFEKGNPFGI